MQFDMREVFLKILEQCGLHRTQGGSALVLTGQDTEAHVHIGETASMPISELAKQYTVRIYPQNCVVKLSIAQPMASQANMFASTQ